MLFRSGLNISGPFNIQFLAVNNDIKVIECNLRCSRSFPFSSKVTGNNFVDIATKAMLGIAKKEAYRTLDLDYVGVKAPQFSFSRLKGADPVLGVEMASTGEVACFGDDIHEAFFKAMLSTGFVVPKENIFVSIGKTEDKADFLPAARKLVTLGFKLHASHGTADFFKENEVPVVEHEDFAAIIHRGKTDWVINVPRSYSHEEATRGYGIRRLAIDNNIPLTIDVKVAKLMVDTLERYSIDDLPIEPWGSYVD